MTKFEKRSLCSMKMPYSLGTIELNGEKCVVGATEDHGPIMLMRPPFREAKQMVAGPGGCMALVEDSTLPGELFAVMECFVGYQFRSAGIYHIRAGAAGLPWSATKIIRLPFAHRIDFIDKAGTRYLIAATLTSDKDDPADWSRPGSLYASRVPKDRTEGWELFPILEGIHRNHGLLFTRFMAKRTVLVSADEGLFAADVEAPDTGWDFRQVLSVPVSEIAVYDIDGDGRDELITIEPFHGNCLCVYRQDPNRWQKVWEAELSYGHCLLAGLFHQAPSILISNRSGNRDLLLYRFEPSVSEGKSRFLSPSRLVIDEGAGAANMLVLGHEGGDLIFAANQAGGEIAVYTKT
jgi:hypothetical protein